MNTTTIIDEFVLANFSPFSLTMHQMWTSLSRLNALQIALFHRLFCFNILFFNNCVSDSVNFTLFLDKYK